jgi:hypothetical protein
MGEREVGYLWWAEMADFLSFLFFFKVKITRMQHMVPISG